jgi:spermidine synthase
MSAPPASIGLGTGSTAGWLAKVPEIERVDAMELEPAILHMARVCEVANLHVLDNPKCHILLGDAREMLITTRQRYDLIFSEPRTRIAPASRAFYHRVLPHRAAAAESRRTLSPVGARL